MAGLKTERKSRSVCCQSRQSHVQPQAGLSFHSISLHFRMCSNQNHQTSRLSTGKAPVVVPLEVPQCEDPIEVPELKPGEARQVSVSGSLGRGRTLVVQRPASFPYVFAYIYGHPQGPHQSIIHWSDYACKTQFLFLGGTLRTPPQFICSSKNDDGRVFLLTLCVYFSINFVAFFFKLWVSLFQPWVYFFNRFILSTLCAFFFSTLRFFFFFFFCGNLM